MTKRILIFFTTLFVLSACTELGQKNDSYKDLVHKTFTESEQVIPNPERGFYRHLSYNSESSSPMSVSTIKANRVQNITLFFTGYYLTDFIESDISTKYLDLVRANFQTLREGGGKSVLRFAYKKSESDKPWDATPKWVLRHIQQLKPIFQEYADVIFCIQAGFVGVWGEWYYTENFVFNPQTPEDHALRKQVAEALLDALPASRQVSLRTPMFKLNMYLNSYADSLTIDTAYKGTKQARLGGHNDCFGASSSDTGTFKGNDSREFWKKETKYLIMGGETCAISNYCLCENSLKDMADYHWTYLNIGYNRQVLTRWKTDGCYDEVERRLGYRLSLTDVYHSSTKGDENTIRVVVKLKNTGFAAPTNPRNVELVLVDTESRKLVFELDDIDPRYWFAGETITIDETLTLPKSVSDHFSVYLNLPDPEPTLKDNPAFSIRLANDGVWNEETGYNKLFEF